MAMLFTDVLAESDESTRKRGIAAALEMPPEFWDNILEYAKPSPSSSQASETLNSRQISEIVRSLGIFEPEQTADTNGWLKLMVSVKFRFC